MPETAIVIAECPNCGKKCFAVYEERKIGKDKLKGKCFACDAEKELRY